MPFYVRSQSIADIGTTLTYTTLTDAVTGNALPPFSTAPNVEIQAVDDMGFYISAQNEITITIVPNGVGSSTTPHTVHLTINDLSAVVGPTPGVDFTAQNEHLFCTPLDIRLESALLTPQLVSDDQLERYCSQASNLVRTRLSRFYTDATLRHNVAPWFKGFYHRAIWVDPEEEAENPSASSAFDGYQRAGFFGMTVGTDFTTVFTQFYTLTFTSASAFTIAGHIEGSVGSGTTSSQFTAGNGDFVLSPTASFGTHIEKNVIFFSIYIWDPTIVNAASWIATALALINEVGNSSKGISALAQNKMQMGMSIIKMLTQPDGKDGTRLRNLGSRQLNVKSKPYDIDILGRNLTEITINNEDSAGNRGEGDFTFLGFSDDYYF